MLVAPRDFLGEDHSRSGESACSHLLGLRFRRSGVGSGIKEAQNTLVLLTRGQPRGPPVREFCQLD